MDEKLLLKPQVVDLSKIYILKPDGSHENAISVFRTNFENKFIRYNTVSNYY